MANQIVLVPQKLLENPPSVREGLSLAVEQQQRIYGCHLIQKAGVLLKLEAVSIASAQTILHRFFFRRSLKQFDVRRVATASLLLACKLEEDPRRVMHLIGVIWLLSQLEDQPNVQLKEETLDNFIIDFDSQEYELFRMDVFRCERYILRELGFMVSQTLVHPHRYILQYIHALFKDNFLFTNQLSQKAWGYLNDSMRTTLCCEVQPAVIAVGSIFLAACDLGIPLPREIGWYELFDVSWEDVIKVCSTILSLYTLPPPSYLKLADETRLVQKALNNTSSGAVSNVRGAPASNSTSNKTRTTQAKDEVSKPVAVEGSASRSGGKSFFASRSGFAGGDLAGCKELYSTGALAANYSEKEAPSSAAGAPGDALKETSQLNPVGFQTTPAADDKRRSREELLHKSAARFSRAQPRAPPPLKERGQTSGRSNEDVHAAFSGRGVGGSPSSSSSFHSSSRGDIVAGSSSTRSTITSNSSSSGTGSSCSSNATGSGGSGGNAVRATEAVPGARLKYIHFPSSRLSPSSDKVTRSGYTSTAVRGGSPPRNDGRDSESSARRSNSPSPAPSSGRFFDREERLRGRQDRTKASRRGNSCGIQATCLLATAGDSAGDKENHGAGKDESGHCRQSQWSSSLSSSNRSGGGRTSGGQVQDGRESETSVGRSDTLRKSAETSTVPHTVATGAGVLQKRNSIPLFARRDKDDTNSLRASSGGTVSPEHSSSSHLQRLSRASRSGNTESVSLSSTLAAKKFSTACATSGRDPEGSGAGNFHYERRQRSPTRSLRCSDSLEDATAGSDEGEKRSVKRQRRPPSHS